MDPTALHQDATVFDGLIVSNWSREVFEDMRRGGLTAANMHVLHLGRLRRHHEEHRPLEHVVSRTWRRHPEGSQYR